MMSIRTHFRQAVALLHYFSNKGEVVQRFDSFRIGEYGNESPARIRDRKIRLILAMSDIFRIPEIMMSGHSSPTLNNLPSLIKIFRGIRGNELTRKLTDLSLGMDLNAGGPFFLPGRACNGKGKSSRLINKDVINVPFARTVL